LEKREDLMETAFDTCTYTRAEVQRLAKGFELAMTRTKKIMLLTKQMYWKLLVYGEKQYKPWKRLSSNCKL
jgi:isocitrate/isopropylmalate dehydrogenase